MRWSQIRNGVCCSVRHSASTRRAQPALVEVPRATVSQSTGHPLDDRMAQLADAMFLRGPGKNQCDLDGCCKRSHYVRAARRPGGRSQGGEG